MIKTILTKSLKHCKNEIDNKPEPTPAMEFGTAFHTAILEPLRFENEYFTINEDLRPNPDKNFTDGDNRKWRLALLEKNAGKKLISAADRSAIINMSFNAGNNMIASNILKGGQVEQSFFWNDADVECKARIDVYKELDKKILLMDFKTCEDAHPQTFVKTIYNYRYYTQLAWYADVLRSYYHKQVSVYICAVEKKAPYCSAVFELSSDLLDAGENECFSAMLRYKKARQERIWTGYGDLVADVVTLPAWYKFD
jgi:hypothetical protein